MTDPRAQIERLNALAEKLGRITGEAHNLVDTLTAKMIARRAATRSVHRAKRRSSPAKSEK
jgi:hypothetical protein